MSGIFFGIHAKTKTTETKTTEMQAPELSVDNCTMHGSQN